MLTDYVFTEHALSEMARRHIDTADVERLLGDPEQQIEVRPGRVVLQSRVESGYLLRVIVDIDRSPCEIVTAYRTSKIGKYWSTES